MKHIDRALKAFVAENPDMMALEAVSSGDTIVGQLFKRTSDGREFYFTAVDEVFGGEVICASKIINSATELRRGLLIHVEGRTYAFKLADVHAQQKGTLCEEKVQYLRFPIRLGVNIQKIKEPIVQHLAKEFETVPVQQEIFEESSIILPTKEGNMP